MINSQYQEQIIRTLMDSYRRLIEIIKETNEELKEMRISIKTINEEVGEVIKAQKESRDQIIRLGNDVGWLKKLFWVILPTAIAVVLKMLGIY